MLENQTIEDLLEDYQDRIEHLTTETRTSSMEIHRTKKLEIFKEIVKRFEELEDKINSLQLERNAYIKGDSFYHY